MSENNSSTPGRSGSVSAGNRGRSWSLPGLHIELMRRSSAGPTDSPSSPAISSPKPVEIDSASSTPDAFIRPRVKGINPDLLTFLNSPF